MMNIAVAPKVQFVGVEFTGKTLEKLLEAEGKHNGYLTVYTFKTDLDLQVGEVVVCDCSTGLSVGTVTKVVRNDNYGKSLRWVVQKVDITAHAIRIEKEKRRAEIRAMMDERRKQLEDEALYRMMAERDPEMAKLINEYYSSPVVMTTGASDDHGCK